ncbi:MAG: family oligoendopeptidase [Bacteroidetes bacterium]|nr:family oligoendopeptidase [Bacteroidota bacterium]
MNHIETSNSLTLKRSFLPSALKIDNWSVLEPFYTDLLQRNISDSASLKKWLLDWSELEAVVSEDYAWRYIRMTCDTFDEALLNSYTFFVEDIEPKIAPLSNKLQKKLIASPFLDELEKNTYFVFVRGIKKSLELFREENIPLNTEINNESQKYGVISSAQTIEHNGEQITLQRAASLLKSTDRELRETIYRKIQDRKSGDETKLNELYTKLIGLRNKVALNAGFKNYRDYKFEDLGRFDYTAQDCYNFHDAIAEVIVPHNRKLEQERKDKLGYESYRPWDTEFDISGREPLKPFKTGAELTEKTIACFSTIDPFFADCITTMRELKHLDLESRVGKAPGGYNYPLYESGVPFIFMNAVGTLKDVVTMVHEGGHAVHSFLCNPLELTDFKGTPSEVAELASMSMELISMEHWESFFTNAEELRIAKTEQLEKILKTLPWIACIDKFQHWVYQHPLHSVEERYTEWMKITKEFGTGTVDYSGFEHAQKRSWQGQLHLFEVPFYYIEYGMAQLGAIAVWRNYKQDPAKALGQYKAALKLGYTKPIPEIYKAAGIKFDFSVEYIKELMNFVSNEYEKLK